jgi:inhibitor of cysteine peptidase
MANIDLTKANAGTIVPAFAGDTITLRLEENPTTGYLWTVKELNSSVLELLSEEYFMAAGTGIGGGGERKLIFRAKEAGTSPLRLNCERRWEPDNPLTTLSITIEVRA